MSKLRPPNELIFTEVHTQAEQWRMWEQEMRLYIQLALSGDSESDKCAAFLYLIGRKGREIYNTWDIPDHDKEKIEVLFQRFSTYFKPKENLIMERYRFNTKTQAEGESLDEFITSTTKLAKLCKYGTLETEMIRDRIVVGIVRTEVKDRLLREPTLTLDSAISICRADEESRKGLDLMKKEALVNTINQGGRKTKDKYSQRKPFNSKPANRCQRCGLGHSGRNCPAMGTTCKKCSKPNHWASMCRATRREPTVSHIVQHSESETDSEEDETTFIGAVYNKERSDNQAFIRTKVNGVEVKFKLDTGAQANVLPWNIFINMRKAEKLKLTLTKHKLCSYSGNTLEVKGTCVLRVLDRIVKFYVVETKEDAILGLHACENLKLIKILQIKEDKCDNSALMKEYRDVFTGLGKLEGQYHIEVDKTVKPVIHAPRKVPFSLHDKVKEELDRMEDMGVIKKQEKPTDWVNSMVVVEKKNGSLRICMDPKDLNSAIKREHYVMSSLEDIMSRINGAKYFAKFDAAHGFWQIELDEDSAKLCTMNTPFGRYSFLRCPFGITSAPEIFNRRIKNLFMGEEGIESFFDDVLVWGKTENELIERCTRCLDIARKANLKFRKEKTILNQPEVKYLGHIINEKGMRADPDKTEAINSMKVTDVKTLQRYLGMVTYVGKYIPNLADLTAPLRELLHKDIQWHWTERHEKAMKQINKLITESPTLIHFDPNKSVTITADASSYGLGAALLQDGLPVAYASRTLNSSEQNYAQIEKETAAVVFACKKFHQYIYGKSIIVESDHKPLQYIFTKPLEKCPPRIQRFMIGLKKYDLQITYVPGKNLQLADALSRDPLPEVAETDESQELNMHVHTLIQNISVPYQTDAKLKDEIKNDEVLQKLKRTIREGWPNEKKELSVDLKPFWDVRDVLTYEDGRIFKGEQLLIPKSLRNEMLIKIHEGHLGMDMCKRRARESIYWPGMSKEIDQLISKCDICLRHRNQQSREPLKCHEPAGYPWEKIATDVFTWQNRDYLLVVDYFTRFVEVAYLANTNSETVVTHLKSMCSRHGIPEIIFSDNASYYTSQTFKTFLREWGIVHKTSSPFYPQSNGLAERMVQTVKRLLKKSKDPYLALLNYRTTPGRDTAAPASLMFGRKVRTNLPARQESYQTGQYNSVRASRIKGQEIQKRYYRGKKHLSVLQPGNDVYMKTASGGNEWMPARIVRQDDNPRSYIVEKGNYRYRRNRRDILRPTQTYEHQEHLRSDDCGTAIVDHPGEVEHVQVPVEGERVQVPFKEDSRESQKKPEDASLPLSQQQRVTRSGRRINAPVRLDL